LREARCLLTQPLRPGLDLIETLVDRAWKRIEGKRPEVLGSARALNDFAKLSCPAQKLLPQNGMIERTETSKESPSLLFVPWRIQTFGPLPKPNRKDIAIMLARETLQLLEGTLRMIGKRRSFHLSHARDE